MDEHVFSPDEHADLVCMCATLIASVCASIVCVRLFVFLGVNLIVRMV